MRSVSDSLIIYFNHFLSTSRSQTITILVNPFQSTTIFARSAPLQHHPMAVLPSINTVSNIFALFNDGGSTITQIVLVHRSHYGGAQHGKNSKLDSGEDTVYETESLYELLGRRLAL